MSLAEIRYAEALADISFQDGTWDNYRSILETISKTFKSQEDFRWFLLSPEINPEIKRETLKKLFGKDLDEKLLNFIMLLIDKSRLNNLPGIVKEFNRQADLRKNVLQIDITSAAPLSESQIERIKEKYRSEYNTISARAEIKIDKSIIGGIIVKIGDRVIDSSVKGRLGDLNNFITGF